MKPMTDEDMAKLKAAIQARKDSKPWYAESESSPKCMLTCDEVLALIARAEGLEPEGESSPLDPRTGRAIGDHGTALQAIDFATEYYLCPEPDAFLKSWKEGSLDEWPEFYEWLKNTDGCNE